jgi:spermidine/putrescine-binding protein
MLSRLLIGSLLFVAATALAQEQRFDGVTLRLATFGGGWDKAVQDLIGQEFEKRGGKMQYVLSPPRESLAKLIAARGNIPFDVLEMDDKTYVDAMTGQYLQKINLNRVPNRKELDPDAYDDYKVGAWVVQEGILFLPDKFKEAGVPAPTRYSDLDNPRLAGKVSFADLSAPGTIHILVSMAVDKGGSESSMQPAYDELAKINPARYWKLAADAQSQLQNGDVWVSTMHQGHALQALEKGMKVAFVHPLSGDKRGIQRPGWLGIVRGTKVPEAAEFFINAYIEAKAQEGLALRRGVVPVNVNARNAVRANPNSPFRDLALLRTEEVGTMLRVDMQKLDPNYADKVSRASAK